MSPLGSSVCREKDRRQCSLRRGVTGFTFVLCTYVVCTHIMYTYITSVFDSVFYGVYSSKHVYKLVNCSTYFGIGSTT